MITPKMLPAPTKEEKRALRLAVKLYNTDLRNGLTPQEAARNWKTRYPELKTIAESIADATIKAINAAVQRVESEMPYKAQWVLEETIKILESRV